MSVLPSYPILIVHPDDAFRRKLIAALDQRHFTVTFSSDGSEGVKALQEKPFRVIVLGVGLNGSSDGTRDLDAVNYVRDHRADLGASVIVVGDPSPDLRSLVSFADETLLKPVDPDYVADRARIYC